MWTAAARGWRSSPRNAQGDTRLTAQRSVPFLSGNNSAPSRAVRSVVSPGADGWAVETHGLTKRFGANVAVDDVELLVPRGCAFGYLGPNGAGKTTSWRARNASAARSRSACSANPAR